LQSRFYEPNNVWTLRPSICNTDLCAITSQVIETRCANLYNAGTMINEFQNRLRFGLSRELWLVTLGIFLNSLGYGAVLPFEVIYLHDGRGFSLGVAGLVVAMLSGVAVVTAPLAGPLIDRFGARAVAAVAGVALAAGYAGLAFAPTPALALLAAVL